MCREMISSYSEIYVKLVNVFCFQNVESFTAKFRIIFSSCVDTRVVL